MREDTVTTRINKQAQIHLRSTYQEQREWKELAAQHGFKNVSEMIRHAVNQLAGGGSGR